MGYPMTWKRVVNRNGLQDGDYSVTPERHQIRVNTSSSGLMEENEFVVAVYPHVVKRLYAYHDAIRMLVGDIRRLEKDALDEDGLCKRIAKRSGVEQETVAVVLKEFFND